MRAKQLSRLPGCRTRSRFHRRQRAYHIMHARQGLAPGRPEIAVTGSMREISPEARQHERHVPSKGDAAVATAGEERQSAARVGPTSASR